jgi:hypothetical protein
MVSYIENINIFEKEQILLQTLLKYSLPTNQI